MSIKVNKIVGNSVADLKADKAKREKGDVLTDADYILRDKEAEAAAGYPNTHDISGDISRHTEEIAKAKQEAREEVKQELLSGSFMADLKAQLKAELLAEAGTKTEPNTGGSKTTGAK